ncbi:HupE/UreJ family protein [Amphiplicatus metriothermophilus]|uniref:HupE / UreJ protein n=1 Tax=Amphiplicatus metriothermophilus TaxID=1519374 RepID=A0A239PWW0_9PROT|nr:HupE/UreJ family protein [Amphiplicatus metriothermophilus]MBB5519908.1 hydrogenase/urease accessory protein HupE [Amphiplicatus metriothermophilus]SNT74811.1 HupE / UreJ protein [Amphiplicatus metriothermophilus]
MTLAVRIALCLIALAAAGAARAHDSRPLTVVIEETGQDVYAVRWRAPASVERANAPTASLGPPCIALSRPAETALEGSALYRCEGGLGDAEARVDWPVYNPSLATLFRLTYRSGETQSVLLGPERSVWTPAAPTAFAGVAANYFLLGVEHILIGIDHILFLFGLLILARSLPRILVTVTGFTIAHSVTLALVALDAARVSVPAVEATIALSIVFVAAEIARGDRTTLAWRRPVLVASAFGLLHGAGFAAALSEIGLPQTERVAALLFFNIGVEAGQLLLVAGALAGAFLWRRLARPALPAARAFPVSGETAAGYGLGLVSAFWFAERSWAVLA